jgi:hypothetical protein
MKANEVCAGLESLRTNLERWRGQRSKGARIPDGLWGQAVEAVRRYGLNPVSRALRLDYYQLKRRATEEAAHGAGRAVFVELQETRPVEEPGTGAGLACVVELEKGNGTRMRICVREAVNVDWGKLKEAFLGA